MDKERYEREERIAERESVPSRPLAPDATDPRADDPHHALANPADEPDPTEYPDPYDRRPDPRGDSTDEPAPRAPSTSEPPPPRNYDEVKPEKGD